MADTTGLLVTKTIGEEAFGECSTFEQRVHQPTRTQASSSTAPTPAPVRQGRWRDSRPTQEELGKASSIVFFNKDGELIGWLVKGGQLWRPQAEVPQAQERSTLYIRPGKVETSWVGVDCGRSAFAGPSKDRHRQYLAQEIPRKPGYAILLEGSDASLSCSLRDISEAHIIIPNPDPYVCHCIKIRLPSARIFATFLGECLAAIPNAVPDAVGNCKLIWADYCAEIDSYAKEDVPAMFRLNLPADGCVLAVTYNYSMIRKVKAKLPFAHYSMYFQNRTFEFAKDFLDRTDGGTNYAMSPFPVKKTQADYEITTEEINVEEQGPYRGKSGAWNM